MQYQFFREQLKDFTVFSLSDIRKVEPAFYRHQLNQWQEKGYIKKIRRGYYIFADTPLDEEVLFLIANRIYNPSYVSFESALSYYGLIPEGVYSITSACGKKTATFHTPVGDMVYRKIKPSALFGYHLQEKGNERYKIAEMEKAVLDYLYLNPRISEEADFSEWRFNSKEFLERVNLVKLSAYADAFKQKSLLARLEKLLLFMNNAV